MPFSLKLKELVDAFSLIFQNLLMPFSDFRCLFSEISELVDAFFLKLKELVDAFSLLSELVDAFL